MFSLSKKTENFIDDKTGEKIAFSVNYWRGQGGAVFGTGGTLDELRQALVLGWGNRECSLEGKSLENTYNFFIYQFWKSGENK